MTVALAGKEHASLVSNIIAVESPFATPAIKTTRVTPTSA
jgi:hypothetical protein